MSQQPAWPALPERDGTVWLPAQEWPLRPGPREIKVLVHYPDGSLKNVGRQSGIMLSLHNWRGTDCRGTADPTALANRLNVVALCVNYLQSGDQNPLDDPEPYDFGYLQALDALRALYWVYHALQQDGVPFASGRIYATGGSGGGNVTLMANKLAPRTFACVVDLWGMAKLTDDIAFNLPGGSELEANYSRDPHSPNYLPPDGQELRFVGCPEHLGRMKGLGAACKVVVVHGRDDTACPFADAQEMVAAIEAAGLDVEPHFIGAREIDGKIFTSTGHALGADRTAIVFHIAGKYLSLDSPTMAVRQGPSDFDCRDEAVSYRTSNGRFVISYKEVFPIGRFEPDPDPVNYDDHQDLLHCLDDSGERQKIRTAADWQIRRGHILANMQEVMGKLPGPSFRVPLDVQVVEETKIGGLVRRKLTYQSDPDDRVAAYLFLPKDARGRKRPAVLCLQQTTPEGKNEPAGLAGNADLHYALELTRRGYVTLAPDYPSFGEHDYDFAPERGYVSGTMKAIWDNIRAVDLLATLAEVDPERIGCIGHSLGGHSAMFTSAFEPRIKVIVSSCGFTSFVKDDLPSWTGPRYMPRIASVYQNDARRVMFDFPEIVASFAPRPFFASAATRDADFDVSGVRDCLDAARQVYELFGQADRLQAYYPEAEHSFLADARSKAYEFLDQHLKR